MKKKTIIKRKAKPINFVRKCVSIRKDQEQLIKAAHINLSRFVQTALDKKFL